MIHNFFGVLLLFFEVEGGEAVATTGLIFVFAVGVFAVGIFKESVGLNDGCGSLGKMTVFMDCF